MKREDNFLKRVFIASLAAHGILGFVVTQLDIAPMVPAGVWAMEEDAVIEIRLPDPIEIAKIEPKEVKVEPKENAAPKRRGIQDAKPKGKRSGGGGGDPLARVTKMGVLGKLTGSTKAVRAQADQDGVTYASDGLTQLIRGVGDTRKVSGGAAKGESGIGFGNGVGSGFGGGKAKERASDLVASLGDGSSNDLVLERRDGVIDGEELALGGDDGCREESSLASIVQKKKGGIRSCYNRSLIRTPGEQGEIAVRFVIAPRGNITDVSILSSSVADPELEKCILERIYNWSFPAKEGCETVVRYTFHFSFEG